jgi:hypothetical protein
VSTPEERLKFAALIHETADASALFSHGLESLRTMRDDFNSAAAVMSLLALGAEKMVKLTIGLGRVHRSQSWPSVTFMRYKVGHRVRVGDRKARAFVTPPSTVIPGHVEDTAALVDADEVLALTLKALDRFGDEGRFYYLDVLAEATQPDPSPADLWGDAVQEIFRRRKELPALIGVADTYEQGRRAVNIAIVDSLLRWWSLYCSAWQTGVVGDEAKRLAGELKIRTPTVL